MTDIEAIEYMHVLNVTGTAMFWLGLTVGAFLAVFVTNKIRDWLDGPRP